MELYICYKEVHGKRYQYKEPIYYEVQPQDSFTCEWCSKTTVGFYNWNNKQIKSCVKCYHHHLDNADWTQHPSWKELH